MSEVFISHSSKDNQVANEIKSKLSRVGIECWVAPQSLPAGGDYAGGILEAIENCETFLCLISENSQNSSWVQKELDVAVALRKRVIAFRLDDSPLSDVYRYYLSACQHIMAQGRLEEAVETLQSILLDEGARGSAPAQKTTPPHVAVSPYSGNKKYIFASYCHKNAERFLEIAQALINEGYRVWYDEGIDPGTEWDEYIAEKIENSGFFVAFVTEEYLASDNCKDELKYARDLQKGRLLVYLSDVQLTGGLAMRLNRLQAIHQYRYPTMDAFIEKVKQTPSLEEYRD